MGESKNLHKVPLTQKLCYGCCEAGEAFSWTYASMYLMYFWTDVMGISMTSTALILLLTRLWDGVNDVIIGVWIDRTRTKWGSFRPFILFSAIPTAIINIFCFLVLPIESQGGKMAYGLITFCMLIFSYSCENVAQNAMPAAMTLNYGERNSLATFRTIGGYGGSILVSTFSLTLVERFGGGSDAKGFFWTTVLYGFAMVILFVISFFGTKETVPMPPVQKERITVKEFFDLYKGNRPMVVMTVLYLAMGLLIYGRSGMAMYYFTYVGGDRGLQSIWANMQMYGSILGTFFIPWLTGRFLNKAKIPQIGWGVYGILMVFLYFLNPGDSSQRTMFFALQFIIGIFQGIGTTGVYGMTADITEYTQHLKGDRRTGSIAAVVSFFNKCGMAFGAAGGAWIIGKLGYTAAGEQSEAVLQAIRIIFTVYPGVFALICVIILKFYTLDHKSYTNIVRSMYDEHGLIEDFTPDQANQE